jgi:hypothetical protein
MRAQTECKYHNLPEVLSKKAEKKKKEDYRTNRLMAEIFARVSIVPLQIAMYWLTDLLYIGHLLLNQLFDLRYV